MAKKQQDCTESLKRLKKKVKHWERSLRCNETAEDNRGDELLGANPKKLIFLQIHCKLVGVRHRRTIKQISNKLKELKKDFREQKKDKSLVLMS